MRDRHGIGLDLGGNAIHVLAFAELLMLTHLAAAIVIPAVARRLGA